MPSTAAADVDLAIPKLRAGSFLPSLLERRRRIDQALFAVVMEAYVTGTSVRKVDDRKPAVATGAVDDLARQAFQAFPADVRAATR